MGGHAGQYFEVLLPFGEDVNVDSLQLLLQQVGEVLAGNFLALASGDHALVGEALGHLLDPVVEGRHQGILKLEGRQQGFLQFEVELNKLKEADFEGLGLGDVEEEENVFDDFLEEGVVVYSQLPVDVGRLSVFIHAVILLYKPNFKYCHRTSLLHNLGDAISTDSNIPSIPLAIWYHSWVMAFTSGILQTCPYHLFTSGYFQRSCPKQVKLVISQKNDRSTIDSLSPVRYLVLFTPKSQSNFFMAQNIQENRASLWVLFIGWPIITAPRYILMGLNMAGRKKPWYQDMYWFMTALSSTVSPIRQWTLGYFQQRQVMMAPLYPRVKSPSCRTGTFPTGYILRYSCFRWSLAIMLTSIREQGIFPRSRTVLTALPGWLPRAQCNFIRYMIMVQLIIIFKQAMEPEEPERRHMDRERQEQSEQQQEYDSFLYKFQQQIIDAWKPVPHTGSNVILYIILCAVCIGLGLGLVLSAPNYPEIEVQYTDCAVGSTCTKTFTLTETLPAPVYFYYGFKGFYQNHRRYLKYFSSTQLDTGVVDSAGVSTDCGDFVTNLQTFGTGATSVGGAALTDSSVAFPCGTIARFFKILEPEIAFNTSGSTGTVLTGPAAGAITISATQTGIAWPSDIGRHKNPTDLNQAGIDVTKETWLVWFRPAARSDFFKLNAVINTDLPAGDYTVTFNSVTVDPTFGQKWFSISKSNFVGNRDLFLGIAFLALGAGCLVLLVVFLAKWIAEKRDRQKFQ